MSKITLKINHEDITKMKKEPIELFYDGLKSPHTKDRYSRILRNVLQDILESVLSGSFEERAKKFVNKTKEDPDWAMDVMVSLSRKLRERTELPKDSKDYFNYTQNQILNNTV